MSSLIRTIWPITAVNPSRTRAALAPDFVLDSVPDFIPDAGRDELAVVRNATDNATGAELESNLFQKAKVGSEYAAH